MAPREPRKGQKECQGDQCKVKDVERDPLSGSKSPGPPVLPSGSSLDSLLIDHMLESAFYWLDFMCYCCVLGLSWRLDVCFLLVMVFAVYRLFLLLGAPLGRPQTIPDLQVSSPKPHHLCYQSVFHAVGAGVFSGPVQE